MTKALTEQWRKGKLPEGYYYIKGAFDDDIYISHLDYEIEEDKRLPVEEVLAPVPSYDEYKELVRKSDKLDKIMSDAVTNQGDCQQIVEDNLNRQIERLQEQLKEANEVIKLYAETTIGHKRKDGTYGMWVCSGEVAWENPLARIETRMDYICYDPRPAKKWLKKWGVK